MASKRMRKSVACPASSGNISVTVSSGVAVSAKSTSRKAGSSRRGPNHSLESCCVLETEWFRGYLQTAEQPQQMKHHHL